MASISNTARPLTVQVAVQVVEMAGKDGIQGLRMLIEHTTEVLQWRLAVTQKVEGQ